MSTIRTFICIELPEHERERLGAIQTRLKRHNARVSWTAPGNIHLTLAFLGDVEETQIPEIVDAVRSACERVEPFDLHLEGAGAFPALTRPRVFWAGVRGEIVSLAELHTRIARALEPLGFERDRRGFKPHLTLGRTKDDRERATAAVARDLADARLAGESFHVDEVIVMRSELNPTGARYTPLARVALRAPEATT